MKVNGTKVVTNVVRFSYLHVSEPKSINGSEPKYSVSLIIPKSDTETINGIKQAIETAKQEGIGKFGGKIPANLKLPLRDGDIDRPGDENYKNSYFVNANATKKPGIVNKFLVKIEDDTEVYSGCYGKAALTFYAFNTSGNKGIACGLNNLMKWEDGEPLGGGSRAEDDFAGEAAEISEEDEDWL